MICFVAFMFATAGIALAGSWVEHTDQQTASYQVDTGTGLFHGMEVASDATYDITVDVYDSENSTTAGKKRMMTTWVITTSNTDRSATHDENPPRRYYKGLYVVVICPGIAKFMVDFEPTD